MILESLFQQFAAFQPWLYMKHEMRILCRVGILVNLLAFHEEGSSIREINIWFFHKQFIVKLNVYKLSQS